MDLSFYNSVTSQRLRADGRKQQRAQDIVEILRLRDVELTGRERERILGCIDGEELKTWFDRAVSAEAARDVFVEYSRAPQDEDSIFSDRDQQDHRRKRYAEQTAKIHLQFAVVSVLEVRRMPLGPASHDAILGCNDLDRLWKWLSLAVEDGGISIGDAVRDILQTGEERAERRARAVTAAFAT